VIISALNYIVYWFWTILFYQILSIFFRNSNSRMFVIFDIKSKRIEEFRWDFKYFIQSIFVVTQTTKIMFIERINSLRVSSSAQILFLWIKQSQNLLLMKTKDNLYYPLISSLRKQEKSNKSKSKSCSNSGL